jgi:hypothetical protein
MTGYLEGHPEPTRPGIRFLAFGLAAILAIGGLTTRLFYLQIVSGGQFAALSQGNRTVDQVSRPDLRSSGQAARHEHPDLRRQDPAGRPSR